MELQFQKREATCLRPIIRETKQTELTQELRLSDGMPDAGRILGVWGQPVIRSKQWSDDQITVSGGVMAWVLYAPEDGTESRCTDVWIPFQMRWDIPAGEPDGVIRVMPVLRFADGRCVSSRKFMIRMGLSVHMEAFSTMNYCTYEPGEMPEGVHILRRTYPLRLMKASGEKIFTVDEEINQQVPSKLFRYTVRPEIHEKKVMGDKVIFRGNLNLNLLYWDESGEICNREEDIPFSQFDQLEDTISGDGTVDIRMVVTSLELDAQDQRLHLKCSLVAQYLIEEETMMELIQDAYGINRDVKIIEETMNLPVTLEQRVDTVSVEQLLQGKKGQILDATFTADIPRFHMGTGDGEQQFFGVYHVIYRGEDESVQNALVRWESQKRFPVGEECTLGGMVIGQGKIRAMETGEGIELSVPLQIETQTSVNQELNMISGMELGQVQEPDPNRPSLILCRPGKENLWSLAKRCGSTVGAIQRANKLDDENPDNRILLIPVS